MYLSSRWQNIIFYLNVCVRCVLYECYFVFICKLRNNVFFIDDIYGLHQCRKSIYKAEGLIWFSSYDGYYLISI